MTMQWGTAGMCVAEGYTLRYCLFGELVRRDGPWSWARHDRRPLTMTDVLARWIAEGRPHGEIVISPTEKIVAEVRN